MAENFKIRFYHRIIGFCCIVFHYVRISLLLSLYVLTHPFTPFSKYRPAIPKCIIDSKHGYHKYIKVNGISLHYVEKGDPTKPLMLFIHGFPEFWYTWRHQIREFSADYWCIAVDMRGFGDSDKPEGVKHYEIPNLTSDIKNLILSLGKSSATLVSHDWGGLISMIFLNQYSSMVDKFIIIGSGAIKEYNQLFWNDWWQFTHGWYVLFFQGPYIPELVFRMNDYEFFSSMKVDNKYINKEDIEAFKYTFGKVGALTPPLNYYRANYAKIYDEIPRETIPVKGLFILGELDEFISNKMANLIKENYGFKTVIMRGCHHFVQQEAPNEVNTLIREYLHNE